jgi:sulfate transport system substrate-binding protein
MLSILAEPPVAWVDKVAKRHGTEALAQAYLQYLYSPQGQEIAAKNFFRPRAEAIAQKYGGAFPKMNLFTIDEVFGGWQKAQSTHFSEGGIFDQIQQARQ